MEDLQGELSVNSQYEGKHHGNLESKSTQIIMSYK